MLPLSPLRLSSRAGRRNYHRIDFGIRLIHSYQGSLMLSRFYKTHFGLTLVSMASDLKVLAIRVAGRGESKRPQLWPWDAKGNFRIRAGVNPLKLNLVDIPRDILQLSITRRLAKRGELAKLSSQYLLARISFRRGATVTLSDFWNPRATYVSFPASQSCYLSLTKIGNQKGIVSMLPFLACYFLSI